MAVTTEHLFKCSDASFYSKTWSPEGTVKAKLVFVHGFGEHINRYNDFFPALANCGIQIFAWDQRGWGRSAMKPSDRGLTGPTSLVLADIAAFLEDKLTAPPNGCRDAAAADVPVFVMGHSMGGGEIMMLAGNARYADLVGQVRGWILSSPFIGFPAGEEPGSIRISIGRLTSRFLPKYQLSHLVPPDLLSRDPAVVDSVRNDTLCHNTGTLEGLASLLDRTAMLSSGRLKLGKHVRSVLLVHGTHDRVCCHQAANDFLEQQGGVNDRISRSYEGAYHQLHADLCRDEFAQELTDWILRRCPAPPAGATPTSAQVQTVSSASMAESEEAKL